MSDKEVKEVEKETKPRKEFNVDDFYRKLTIWLLVILLIVIALFNFAILSIQYKILDKNSDEYINKGSKKVLVLEEDDAKEQNSENE